MSLRIDLVDQIRVQQIQLATIIANVISIMLAS